MSTDQLVKTPKKLIEVALPLDAINSASVTEKQPFTRRHPRSLHIWWARRPLVAARAVIFSQLVNDPSWRWELDHPGEAPPCQLKASWAASRKRLFSLIEELVKWENTSNEAVLERARAEIRKSWRETCEVNREHPQATDLFNPNRLPGMCDPFAGGGTIPLEAQRLGLEALGSDLNPVAVLINKAMVEIPPSFADQAPVGPMPPGEGALLAPATWRGAQGLLEDVRRYGTWIDEQAKKRIGHLHPTVEVTSQMADGRVDLKPFVGRRFTVVAYVWSRTVKSPNPAFRHVEVPLASTFVLSAKEGREAYVMPVVDGDRYRFAVRVGRPADEAAAKRGTKSGGSHSNFLCLVSGTPMPFEYLRTEAKAGRMGARLMAIICDGLGKRIYLPPSEDVEAAASAARPVWKPDLDICHWPGRTNVVEYGLTKFGDLFTPRQLAAMAVFNDLVIEAREKVYQDAICAGMQDDSKGIDSGGIGATAYAEAVSVYLGIAQSRWADLNNTLCTWNATNNNVRALFSRQAIPMTWDFVELNVFGPMAGFKAVLDSYCELAVSLPAFPIGHAEQVDARRHNGLAGHFVSTDPPYYDNIGYASLADFFYVWLRRCLRSVFPHLLATIGVPKAEELVATPYGHGSKGESETFFLEGMTLTMKGLAAQAHPGAPLTIYYAFKQSETEVASGTSSTGWETFLEAVSRSDLTITGTWPMRTERAARSVGIGSNALASSIVLVCRPRPRSAPTTSRRAFLRELNRALPEALDGIICGSGDERSPVAPVDLSQAIIGPGMAVFSKYSAVLEADGTPMSVKTALQLINRFLAEDDFDCDTQFCLHWFEQHGWAAGKFGDAETLSRAKGTSVDGVRQAGVLHAAAGVVRLVKWAEYPSEWNPKADGRLPVWEVLHQLIRVFMTKGETGAGDVLAAVQTKAEAARQLAYRLYTLCERAGQAEDARAYNELITSWSAIENEAVKVVRDGAQLELFGV